MPVNAVSLPFREQAEFFRRKLNMPTQAWADIYSKEHDFAFMVAGANRDDLLADFRESIDKVIAEGATLESFRQDFDRIVKQHGWSYNGGRNWRSRIIYETNLNSSYMAGRYQQLLAVRNERPYWQYLHSDAVEHPRLQHQRWNGMVLRWDDPWWQHFFPPNGWGCQCRVIALSDDDLKRMGKSGPDVAPPIEWENKLIGQRSAGGPREVTVPKGIDPGFEHVPGRSRLESEIPPEKPVPAIPGSTGGPGLPNLRPPDPLPASRSVPADRLLPTGLDPQDYVQQYLQEFGATLNKPVIFRDVVGEAIPIGKELFEDEQGLLKLKRGREQYLLLLADALKAPDEIWARLEWHFGTKRAVVRRRYISQVVIAGEDKPLLAVFERGSDGWWGVTTFQGEAEDADNWRVGVRLYRRQ